MYETVWMRWFRLAFGSTSHAVSATLCAYFLGLAIGAALFGRIAGRSSRPLRLYGWVELAAAGAALLVPLALRLYDHLYPALYDALSGEPIALLALKVALALAAMLPCAILLGGSLPPLVTAGLAEQGRLGREGTLLYWANISGGVLGAAGAGLFLPELLGVPLTYACGVAASAAAGAGALWLARRSHEPPRWERATHTEPSERAPATALAVAAVSGFSLLGLEVLLVHALGRFFAHSTYSFSLVLLAVLSCMAVGAAIVAWLRERPRTDALLRWALLLEVALLLALPGTILALRESLDHFESPLARGALAVGAVGVPALLVAGLILPLTFRLASGGPAGPRVGGLLAANTLGGILGSLAASFVLLERLGLWGSFGVLGLVYAAAVPWLASAARARAAWAGAVVALVLGFAATPLSPLRLPVQNLRDGERLLASFEGADGLVSIGELGGARFVAIDEHYMFGDTSQSATYQRMGRLPLLLHPDPKRVLVIGSATGGLAAAAVEVPVEEIVLVEIISELHGLAATFFGEHNRHVHRDPRAHLVTEDGRNHLRGTREHYDVIIEDLFIPHQPSAAAMYTTDHYRDALTHLTERGVFCQWLPLYQLSQTELSIIVATFREVFPRGSLWTPGFRPLPILGLVATRGDPPSVAELAERGKQLAALGVDDPWLTDPVGLWAFHLGAVSALDRLLGRATPNSDARPSFDFVSGRTSLRVQGDFAGAGWPRLMAQLVALEPEDGIFAAAPREPARAGDALATANRLAATGRAAEAQQLLQRASRLVPDRLIAERDESVSNVWPVSTR